MLVAVAVQAAVLDQHHQLVADQAAAVQVIVVMELQTEEVVVVVEMELLLVMAQDLEQVEQVVQELLL
jgi:hypothetical protein